MRHIVLLLLMVIPCLAQAEPGIRFESELHDFGIVKQGDFLEWQFAFTNTGTDDLLIRKITPS